jgi:addiction module HigA family antidote
LTRRLCFRFADGDAFDVAIVDYHCAEMTVIKSALPPIHPGRFLREILEERGVSQARFARAIGVAPMRVSHLVNGARPVTAELALLFSKALGQSPQYWLNLQASYDLKLAEKQIGARLRSVSQLQPA